MRVRPLGEHVGDVRWTCLSFLQKFSLPDAPHPTGPPRSANKGLRIGNLLMSQEVRRARVFFETASNGAQVSVLRRTLQHEPWQVSWLKATRVCRLPSFPRLSVEWCRRQRLFVYSGGTAPVSLRTSLLSPIRAPWVMSVVSRWSRSSTIRVAARQLCGTIARRAR